MDEVHSLVECSWQHPSTILVEQFSTKLAIVPCSGYCCGVDMWHTLLIVISLSTCIFWHYWLIVAKKKIEVICVVVDFVCTWIVVENVVAKEGGGGGGL